MADPLAAVLREAADRLCADETTPKVGLIHARVRPRPARPGHPGRGGWKPALAAVAALAVVASVQLIPRGAGQDRPVTIPPPPALGSIVPPMDVRTRLGAPGGHVNGPAVDSADLLAVAPTRQEGLTLRTVGVVRDRPKPDASGQPLVDRCVYTYSEPERAVLDGECQWAAPAAGEPEPLLTLALRGAPGRTFLTGAAPTGTAAVLLQAVGTGDVVVPVASAGTAWQDRPRYLAWWPRVATSVVALDREGRELARTRLPSPEPVRSGPEDPELGTVELDAQTTALVSRFSRPGRAPGTDIVGPKRVDVLARLRLGPQKSIYLYGFVDGGNRCVVDVMQDFSGAAQRSGFGGSCGPVDQSDLHPIRIQRSFSAGTGEPGEQLISGSAPAGTARVVLSTEGAPARSVDTYDGGPRWDHRAFFVADWPSAAPTTVRALDVDGRTLAVWNDKGINPDQFDPAYLEAFARCLEAGGVDVTRHPQPHADAPAYEYGANGFTGPRLQTLEAACERQAGREN